METPFFHRLGSVLWGGIVILLVTLAVYVSVGRLLLTNVSAWHAEIEALLNSRGPFVVEAERLRGEWRSFSPVLVLSGLRLGLADSAEPPLQLSEGRATVDVLNSLRSGTLQLSQVVLEDLNLYGELTRDGALRLQGLGTAGGDGSGEVRDFLLNVEAITLRNNRLVLTLPDGEVRSMAWISASSVTAVTDRWMSGSTPPGEPRSTSSPRVSATLSGRNFFRGRSTRTSYPPISAR